MAIEVTPEIKIQEKEIELNFVRSSGPGGQNINKVSTAVQLRLDIKSSASLPVDVKKRLFAIAKKKINKDGVLVITANRYRTQEQNRQDALERLISLVQKASVRQKPRKPTVPNRRAKQKRLDQKHRRSEVKRMREKYSFEDDW